METQKPFTFKKTNLMLVLSVAAIFVAWGAYAYLFHHVTLWGNADATLALEADKLDMQQSQALELKNDLAANQAQQPVLDSYFVDATDPVPLFETLQSYGATTGVAVSIDSVEVALQPNRLMVTLTSDGSFADTYRFLALLEAAPYEFSFTSVSVKALANTAPNGVTASGGTVWESHVTMAIASVTGVTAAMVQK